MNSTPLSPRANQILDIAQERMQRGGLAAVSHREIADIVGIKSASVHYHFPHKDDLGRAVVERYAAQFMELLGPADDPQEGPKTRIARLTAAYRETLDNKGVICLCAILGAESLDLPDQVREAVKRFFDGLLAWTETAIGKKPPLSATHIVGALQGAMMLAIATGGSPAIFDDSAKTIVDAFNNQS